MEILVFIGLTYCLADIILSVILRRCVLPGLRCRDCRGNRPHKVSQTDTLRG